MCGKYTDNVILFVSVCEKKYSRGSQIRSRPSPSGFLVHERGSEGWSGNFKTFWLGGVRLGENCPREVFEFAKTF